MLQALEVLIHEKGPFSLYGQCDCTRPGDARRQELIAIILTQVSWNMEASEPEGLR